MAPATPSLKIRDEVAALKRERTIGAAVDLFYEEGYDNATLDEVAERLGVTKPFIYANFGSKSELLAEICSRGVQAAQDAIDGVLAKRLSPSETMKVFALRYVAAILDKQKHIAVYTREEKNLDPADARRIGEMRRDFFGKMTKLLERGVASGEFDVDDAHIASFAIAGAVSWATFWYRSDGRLTQTEIAEVMTKLILALAGAADYSDRRKQSPARARAQR
jgi:TetR/AcrR family transcriptional regulator, cholesterol catabolism regulator